MSEDKRFYVYVHRRKTDGRIFYVGKGQGNRAYDRQGRNTWWQRVVAKYDFYAEIVFRTDVEKCAFSIESGLIRYIGRDNLCNLSDGGEGPSGRKHTEEWRASMSQKMSGRKLSKEHKESLRQLRIRKPTKNFASNQIGKEVTNSSGETFGSICEASRCMAERTGLQARPANIIRACKNPGTLAFGLSWSMGNSTPERRPDRVKKVVRISTGAIYDNMAAACVSMQEEGIACCRSGIRRVLKQGRGMAYGSEWRYLDEDT